MSNTTTARVLSGPELRTLREQAGLGRTPVARAYGASRSAIANIEAAAVVTPWAARRYVEALREAFDARDEAAVEEAPS